MDSLDHTLSSQANILYMMGAIMCNYHVELIRVYINLI